MAVKIAQTAAQIQGKNLSTLEDNQVVEGRKRFERSPDPPFEVESASALVTNLDADKLDGQHGAFYQSASNLTAGTLPDARLPNPLPAVSGENLSGVPRVTGSPLVGNLLTYGGPNSLAPVAALPSICCGRATVVSGVPLPATDQLAKTSVYWTPYQGNLISLWNGTAWVLVAFAELTWAVPNAANAIYDVFGYLNAGVLALEASAAWTSDSAIFGSGPYAATRPVHEGVEVKSTDGTAVDNTRRWLFTVRTTGVAGETEDSLAKGYVYNAYNQKARALRVIEPATSWALNSQSTYRQANGNAANQVDVVAGRVGELIVVRVLTFGANGAAGASAGGVAIGEDSATTMKSGSLGGSFSMFASTGGEHPPMLAEYAGPVPIGRHYYTWLERAPGASNITFYGDNNQPTLTQAGIQGLTMR